MKLFIYINKWKPKVFFFSLSGAALVLFLIFRMFQPLSIFVVSDDFAYPIDVGGIPEGLTSVSVKECGQCHAEITEEWMTSMHAKAWTDPYFQVDFVFDKSLQICLNCHTPLKNQQENLVLGFKDKYKLDPILSPNDNYDASLRDEGVTCAVCHIRDGMIYGPHGSNEAPHSVKKDKRFTDGFSICKPCHMVMGDRWDTFYKIPPCGTVEEIQEEGKKPHCTGCHMPKVESISGTHEKIRIRRKHLFRGGHYPDMVKKAIKGELIKENTGSLDSMRFLFKLTNIGTDHRLPTGTPDRHLTVTFKLFGDEQKILEEKTYRLIRTILWRPFIIDLWDTRLKAKETRSFPFEFQLYTDSAPISLEVTVRYHLLEEKRRKRIGFQNKEPINYEIFKQEIRF